MLLPKQVWRDVKEYEGKYQVSNTGKVRSLNYRQIGKTQVLKSATTQDGYLFVRLCKNGKAKTCRVNRLVAAAFIPNPNNLPEVNHRNEQKQDNRSSNLEWCTREYNNNYGTRVERAAKANKGKQHTEETKKKISKANKGNKYGKKKVICLELKRVFNSAKEASEFLDYSRGSLSTAIKKGHKCRGLTFKYIEIIEL